MKIRIQLLICILLLTSCAKEWLDTKSDDSFIVPRELNELQALLDNTNIMAQNVMANVLEFSTDNVELTESQWKTKDIQMRNTFVWAVDIDQGLPNRSWTNYYGQVYYANTVLEGLNKLSSATVGSLVENNIRGQAYFFRAWAHFNLLQLFAKQYDKASAVKDPGIPLRQESLLTQPTVRKSVQEGYDFILTDMAKALQLLPDEAKVTTRPSKRAAYAFMARLYLQKGDYAEAKAYADSVLSINGTLLEFKNQNQTSSYPFKQFNDETIFYQTMSTPSIFVDRILFSQYQEGDYRKKLFFRQSGDQMLFKGSYSNAANYFAGLATDEVFLIRSECNARLGNYDVARQDLLQLLQKRYDVVPTFPDDDKFLLNFILTERRKELIFRGVRWLDLRRLNKYDDTKVVLSRSLGNNRYELNPNSSRYIFAVPLDVILSNPKIEQNIRE